jgi:hypothetical protein
MFALPAVAMMLLVILHVAVAAVAGGRVPKPASVRSELVMPGR